MDSQHKLSRLYVSDMRLSNGINLSLSEGQTHYLRNVMRKAPGDVLRVFNGQDGEWLCTIETINKKNTLVKIDKLIHEQKSPRAITVYASPVKKEAFEWMVEKAAELGATQFIPVLCERSVIRRVNHERLQAIAIEAAEQCERLHVMKVSPEISLKNIFESNIYMDNLIFCLERKNAERFESVAKKMAGQGVAILIGPEGGFTEQEINFIQEQGVHTATLGAAILKTETALISALAGIQLLS